MIKGIEHVAVFTDDTKALADWYCNTLDTKIVYDNGKGTYFVAFESGDMLEICKASTEMVKTDIKVAGLRHLALSVEPSDFNDTVAKLKAANVEVITDAVVSDKGVGTFFFRDFGGNIVHLISREKPLY